MAPKAVRRATAALVVALLLPPATSAVAQVAPAPLVAAPATPAVQIADTTAPDDPVGHYVRLLLGGATLLGLAGIAGLYLTRRKW